jgi:hypothetical protein
VVISHDAFRVDEEKAATPDPLMGLFPLGFDFDHETEQATLAYYLKMAKRYIGSPMLSALYGVWAARSGNRRLSLDLLDRGYGDFCTDRFMQTLEYRKDVFPEQPPAGPFFANLGGFLLGLILGFPRIQPGPEDPQEWCKGTVVLYLKDGIQSKSTAFGSGAKHGGFPLFRETPEPDWNRLGALSRDTPTSSSLPGANNVDCRSDRKENIQTTGCLRFGGD